MNFNLPITSGGFRPPVCRLLWALALFVLIMVPGNGILDAKAQEQAKEQEQAQDQENLSVETAPQEADASPGLFDQQTIASWSMTSKDDFEERVDELADKVPGIDDDIARAFDLATSPERGWSGRKITAIIVLLLLLALVVEFFTTRKLLQKLYNYVDTQEKTNALKFRFIAIRLCIQLVGLVVLGTVAYAAGLVFVQHNPHLELLYTELLASVIRFRFWLILIRNIFSPQRVEFRPIPLADAPARQIYAWTSVFFLVIEAARFLKNYLTATGADMATITGLMVPYTLVLQVIILSQLWMMRKEITHMFISEEDQARASFGKALMIQAWPALMSAWLVLLWMLWLYNVVLGHWDQASQISTSWWITLVFPVADRMFHGLIRKVEGIEWLQSPRYENRSTRFVRVVQGGFRFVLVGLAVYLISNSWGFETNLLMTESNAQVVLRKIINVALVATIAYIVWELVHALVERRMPEEETDAVSTLEGEGGAGGATRSETLMPLMRTVMTVILVIILVLTILSSLGVAIGPLLAGAGVVGIAIGFGAQKLVQDIIGGIFFLLDDAFRKGEYIELENLRGTVEKISLRSMQLRHHLGAVQTIPYGEIRTVKNLSRDWITMKLELRLPYDADIEQVRKIIKKVGQQMLEDPELGPSFILPLKSQGVMRVEESALIVRMKFTTKPGEQWVIRREAYRQVRDALAEAGIHFAHREVRVRVDDDHVNGAPASAHEPAGAASTEPPESRENKIAEAAGAAITSMLAEEARRQGKLDGDDADDDR